MESSEEFTFTFKNEYANTFRRILSRLDPDEYTVVQDVCEVPTKDAHSRQVNSNAVIIMEPIAALTFRLAMKDVTIAKKCSDEETAEREAIRNRHKISISVSVLEDE